MKCKCRNCGQVYIEDKKTCTLAGYCSHRCVKKHALSRGFDRRKGLSVVGFLNSIHAVGRVQAAYPGNPARDTRPREPKDDESCMEWQCAERKTNLRRMVLTALDDYIEESEDQLGPFCWVEFDSVDNMLLDFAEYVACVNEPEEVPT